jgi:S-adenosylmethionine synthetase
MLGGLMRNIVVEDLHATPVSEHKIEIVERKGTGHPDFMCDAIMNQVSIELCKEYLKRFGAIMHHNIDKGMLVAGEAQQKFGGGKIITPMLLIFGDRATFEVGERRYLLTRLR